MSQNRSRSPGGPQKTFSRTIEDFDCEHCGTSVKGDGYTNHCPSCLWSRHVDNSPGDRGCKCHGLMEPLGYFLEHQVIRLIHKCKNCKELRVNRSHENDNRSNILGLANISLAEARKILKSSQRS